MTALLGIAGACVLVSASAGLFVTWLVGRAS